MSQGIDKLSVQDIKPLRDVVFDHLRDAILDGVLKPGERLMEVQLAEKLGVSRTPVREAIRKLEIEGFVEMIPRRGAQVSELSINDVENVLEVREVLEGLAAFLAASKIKKEELSEFEKAYQGLKISVEEKNVEDIVKWDSKFHDILLNASENPRLIKVNSVLIEQVHRFRKSYVEDTSTAKYILASHKKILEAIKEKNPEKARKVSEDHIREIKNFILEKHKKSSR